MWGVPTGLSLVKQQHDKVCNSFVEVPARQKLHGLQKKLKESEQKCRCPTDRNAGGTIHRSALGVQYAEGLFMSELKVPSSQRGLVHL